MLNAAEKRGDEWALKITERITKHADLPALDARYHRFCQRKLYKSVGIRVQRGERSHDTVDEAMEKKFNYLEENLEECQFP